MDAVRKGIEQTGRHANKHANKHTKNKQQCTVHGIMVDKNIEIQPCRRVGEPGA